MPIDIPEALYTLAVYIEPKIGSIFCTLLNRKSRELP